MNLGSLAIEFEILIPVVLRSSFPPLFSAFQLGNQVCLLTSLLRVALGGRQLVTEALVP